MLGPPGAGKGTQAERFARSRGIPKISTGDILREAVQTATDVGRPATPTMDRGELISDDVMIGIVRDRLDRDNARTGFVPAALRRTARAANRRQCRRRAGASESVRPEHEAARGVLPAASDVPHD